MLHLPRFGNQQPATGGDASRRAAVGAVQCAASQDLKAARLPQGLPPAVSKGQPGRGPREAGAGQAESQRAGACRSA